ncbi:serine aminopeptidase domain-containing protein [Ureibacillus sp. GCM10028918]|uniref:serine aminopeptidase domain-containing protein n=1 Tax=Ureibacillus sp. GCM10028918 TaxID=3273429 RepID=UPI003616DAB9
MVNTNNQYSKMSTDVVIEKTIFASVMDNGFWHRWIVHGIDEEFIKENKSKMISLKGWTETLAGKALEYTKVAGRFEERNDFFQAEHNYRKAAIYYNLAQWVFPEPSRERIDWYKRCVKQTHLADQVSEDTINHHTLSICGKKYVGRVRIPKGTLLGLVILVIPIDSTKEEFFLYEQDFAKKGFVVISFDGTGQGETLLIHGHKADIKSFEQFTQGIIEFAYQNFPDLSINLFGTSSGGAWAIEASKNSLVSKTAVVSPPPKSKSTIKLPDYFIVRMSNMLVDIKEDCLPLFETVEEIDNILMFHGGKDLLVNKDELLELFNRFAQEKRFLTYDEEGHCCNFKLPEIRRRVSEWFKGGNIHDI